MPCPHNEITIVQRSQRQSAVAAAAYQSGEKLFCEYDQQVKHYPEKRGIVHNEILLPANAPPEYADRNTLSWNSGATKSNGESTLRSKEHGRSALSVFGHWEQDTVKMKSRRSLQEMPNTAHIRSSRQKRNRSIFWWMCRQSWPRARTSAMHGGQKSTI